MPTYKKGPKGGSGEHQVCQSDLNAGEGYGAGHLDWHHTAHRGQPGNQPRFMKGRSCLTNLISFNDKVTCLVDEGKAVSVVYLDFSKAFDTISHSVLLEKLAAHGLDKNALHWVKNWLEARPGEWW
ncbi:rna-directed dna polymerase from mobile element jockey-like [Limosa lapponica baueri]|uniref:Rna-directed dna polymerase from mobile element jockey-like n=1 Tax=Limosa lapponica baueri TaxID=1758121 RepID=A0A2I0TJ79_LIMLA|nr:rna-directed dna polymerase from mobile element jockey-like [Limosa lapponica baueri]